MKYKCDKCKQLHKMRTLLFVKGKYLCFHCRQKTVNKSMNKLSLLVNHYKGIPLEEALEKEYKVKSYYSKKLKRTQTVIGVPSCLGGYIVKLSLIKKDGKSKS